MTEMGKTKDNNLPSSWAFATLSQLIGAKGIFVDGDWIESKDQDPDGDVRLIQLADVGDGTFIDKSSRFLTSDKAEELNCTFLQRNDILIARMPEPLGRACIFPLKEEKAYVTAVDVCISRPHDDLISRQFIMHAINSPSIRAEIDSYKSGSTRKRISRKNLDRIQLPIAPLNEQNRIVAKIEELFSELDAGVENLTKAKEQLGVYRQSLLKHAFEGKLTEEWRKENADKLESGEALLKRVKKEREEYFKKQLEQWEKDVAQWEADGKPGKKPNKPKKPKKLAPISDEELKELPELPEGWVWVTLEEMCDVKGGITVSSKTKYDDPKEVPYLRVANVQDCNLDLSEIKTIFVSQEKIDQLALQEGDILLNEGGDRDKLGRGWIWESQLPLCIHQNHVFRARQYYRYFPSKYISYYASAMGKPYFMGQGKQTTNLASISLTKMKAFPIPIPPEKEADYIVQEIESKLNESLSTANDLEDRIFQVSILRSSILHAAFSGSLVPQDPNDEPASKLLERIKQERKSAPKPKRTRKPKTKTKRITMADLKEVLATAKDWVSAQDAFRQCGVSDGAPTDDVEKLYEELKQQLDLKVIEVERRGDEDWLRLAAEG